jgi:DNA repair protein RAD50
MIASFVIRIALAETFPVNCEMMALDEPIAHLDGHNLDNVSEGIPR